MRPIKWKGIASGLTIYCCQKMSQTILQNSLCKKKLKIMNFSLFFKKRSRDDFLLDSSWFAYPWPTQKCKKTQSDIILVSNPLSDSSAKKTIKNMNFVSINLWVPIAHKFMVSFWHKFMQKNCINLCEKAYHFLWLKTKC